MNETQLSKDYFFVMSFYGGSNDYMNIKQVINQGIDARLTAFTKSEFKFSNADNRLYCWIHLDELEILIRRLLELNNDDADYLADDIVEIQYEVEVI